MKRLATFFFVAFFIASGAYGQKHDSTRSISMLCGEAEIEIQCGYNSKITDSDDRICNHNNLIFYFKNTKKIIQSIPDSHDKGSTPIGFACHRGNDQKMYVVVSYLSGSYNCSKCHVVEVYSSDGRILTDKTPSVSLILEKKLWDSPTEKIRDWPPLTIESRGYKDYVE
ncbi:MAG: hypothetical protein SFZ03_10230 [Candidatus Melainabacteria bacterium]|nr:hypothetical protein [Candidatus Melainabacteria bacterium]